MTVLGQLEVNRVPYLFQHGKNNHLRGSSVGTGTKSSGLASNPGGSGGVFNWSLGGGGQIFH